MNVVILSIVLELVLIDAFVEGKDLVLGDKNDIQLVSTERIMMRQIPLVRREKDYMYKDSLNRKIKAIVVQDLALSESEVNLVSGGVGAANVTLHLKSEKGEGLNFVIMIFTRKNKVLKLTTAVDDDYDAWVKHEKTMPGVPPLGEHMLVFQTSLKRKFPLNFFYYTLRALYP